MTVKISDLSAASSIADTDLFAIVQSGDTVTNKITWLAILNEIVASTGTTTISQSKYTSANPATKGRINFSDTSDVFVGLPLLITQNGLSGKLHLVTSITTNTNIDVSGPPLALATAIDSIEILPSNKISMVDLILPGLYLFGGTTTDALNRSTNSIFRWNAAPARLVYAAMRHETPDTDSVNQPEINVTIDGTDTILENSGNGLVLPDAQTWIDTSPGEISNSANQVNFGDEVEVSIKAAGGDLDARDLTVTMTFVFE